MYITVQACPLKWRHFYKDWQYNVWLLLSLLATMSIDEAIRQSLQYMYNKTNGRGGLIMITK